ncbi:hypothetical protein LAUMK7_00478 [Mycobacterium kansasii]|uniref:SRPBCC family protein n=1 Tax=Mycobacterium kansasii TaxID=1768 RepID=UPI000F040EE3|nr:SRPBCC family protein [Mycobacterium kansasii]VAZ70752.1 hypothetical protein LAUMK7_00478 [Mycobacterium kansasii]
MSWWAVCAERALSESVPAQPDWVRDFYVDLDKIKLAHPLIMSVQPTDCRESANGYLQSYRVVDRIPLGPLRIRTSYRVRLYVPVQGDVSTEADQWPRIQLRVTVSFEPIDTGTRLTERIRITAPRLLAAFTIREAVKAHRAMLSGIRGHFECRSAG